MIAQHLPKDLLQPSTELKQLAQMMKKDNIICLSQACDCHAFNIGFTSTFKTINGLNVIVSSSTPTFYFSEKVILIHNACSKF